MNDTDAVEGTAEGREGGMDWRSVIMLVLVSSQEIFHCCLPISSRPMSSCIVYLPAFIFIQLRAPCLAWEEGNSASALYTYLETLCTSSMCAFLFVLSICISSWVISVCVDGVVKTVDPQLHNRELHPIHPLNLHHRDPCDLWYLRPPSQLLGTKTKEREWRKCGNKRQRGREEKHVLNSEKNKK